MSIGNDTFATRRHLPHLARRGATYFVTFTTIGRYVLAPEARDVILACCVHNHLKTYFLDCACVMPDHVHIVITPYEEWTLAQVLGRIKGVSARFANEAMHRRGPLWQDESFDRMIRSSENLRKKCEYICNNPVRAGLVENVDDYPWIWREWIEGRLGQAGLPVLH